MIFEMPLLVCISTPASRAAAAMALEMAPVPPRQNRLHEAAHLQHRLGELFVSFSVEPRMARDLAPRLAVIVHPPEIIAVGHRREGSVQRQDFQPMPRQVELADDLWSQQRYNI